MNAEEFQKRLRLASCFCRYFTDKHISESLPEPLRYKLSPADRKKCENEKVILNKRAYLQKQLDNLSFNEVFEILFFEEKVPVWANLHVSGFDVNFTYIEVTISEDFTHNDDLLFHQKENFPPFHVMGPTVPDKWRSLEEDGSFPFQSFT